jgi:hypothetical protein
MSVRDFFLYQSYPNRVRQMPRISYECPLFSERNLLQLYSRKHSLAKKIYLQIMTSPRFSPSEEIQLPKFKCCQLGAQTV